MNMRQRMYRVVPLFGLDQGGYVRKRLTSGAFHCRNRNASAMQNVSSGRQFKSSMLSPHTQRRIRELYAADECLHYMDMDMENVSAERQFTSSMLSAHTQSRILGRYRSSA